MVKGIPSRKRYKLEPKKSWFRIGFLPFPSVYFQVLCEILEGCTLPKPTVELYPFPGC